MTLIHITIALLIISIILFVLGAIIKKKIIIISGGIILSIIIIFWIAFFIWSMCEAHKELERNQIDSNIAKERVDLSNLDSYIDKEVPHEKAKELLNKICEEYSMYLLNSAEDENGKGLVLYFSKNANNNSEIEQYNNVVSIIKNYIDIIEKENTVDFNITRGIDDENRQYIYILKEERDYLDGKIVEVGETYIMVQRENSKNVYKVNADIETNQFINNRTNERIKISDIKVGDYYDSDGILRDVSGDEWKKECIKNLANCYEEGDLWCNPQEITNVRNMEDYVIVTLTMVDSSSKYFNNIDSESKFELKAIAYSNLDIPTYTGGVTVYNLKEKTKNQLFWIGLEKDTINNKYPVINDVNIYDL